jgi:hypothetical protein
MAFSDEKTLPVGWMKNSPYYIATVGRRTRTSRTPGFIMRKESHRLYTLDHGGGYCGTKVIQFQPEHLSQTLN